jgi:DNA-binding CsgD family transcriptional regulator
MASTLWLLRRNAYPRFLGYYAAAVSASAPRNRARQRVSRLCESGADARTVRLDLLKEIDKVVDFDAFAWLLTDPETSVGSSPLADVPCLPELPRLIRLKYATRLNRWTTLATPVALLSVASGGDLSRSLLWRELLCRYDVGDIASSVYRDRYGCWGFLDLWRTNGRFTSSEAAFLADIATPVTTALRRAQANTFVAERRPRPRGPVVLLLSPDLDVRAQTPETGEYLRALVPPDGEQEPVPAAAYNVAAQLVATEAGIDSNPPSARVHLSGGLWLSLRAARIGDPGNGNQRDIAVSVEETAPDERAALFARAHGLSPRETELLLALASGGDTRQLARQLFVSEHTVQDHLRLIFTKTGARSRTALLARALGT